MNDLYKSLSTNEKVKIVVLMSLLAVLLLGAVIPTAVLNKSEHVHSYEGTLEFKNGAFSYVARCSGEGCDDPEIVKNNVSVVLEQKVDATYTSEGKAVYSYTYGGNKVTYTIVIDKLTKPDHVHSYAGALEFENGVFNYVARCSGEGCDEPEVVKSNVSVVLEEEVLPSCTSAGRKVYSYTDDGKTVFCTIDVDKSPCRHALDYTTLVKPTLDAEGEISTYCTNPDCTKGISIPITLPKIATEGASRNVYPNEDGDGYVYIYDPVIWPEVKFEIEISN